MLRSKTAIIPLAAIMALSLAACESDGGYRVSSVGSAGTAGGDGSPSPADDDGSGGGGDSDGGLTDGLTDNDALAVGGLVGPEGVAGTGLLAETGSLDEQSPIVANVLTTSGSLVNVLADDGLMLVSAIDDGLAADGTITGSVIGVVEDTGAALVQTGQGEQYLVDGLVAAPGELVTVGISDGVTIGSGSASPLIGASVLSADQVNGSLATVGLASDGNLVNLGLSLNDATLGTSGLTNGTLNPGGGLLNGVTGTVNGATGGAIDGTAGGAGSGVTDTVQGTVDAVTGGLLGGN